MRCLNRLYAVYHNQRYQFSGHCFDGPYQAYPQPSPLLLLRTVAYVFLNPVDAGLAPAPEAYRWSCFRSYTPLVGETLVKVEPAHLLARVDERPKRAWELFHRAMEREAHRPKLRNPAKLTMVEAHARQFEWLLEFARERATQWGGEDPDVVSMYWGKQYGISSRAIARVLRMDNPAEVSRQVYRLRKRLESNPTLAHLLKAP
jgi:hypothetical protein